MIRTPRLIVRAVERGDAAELLAYYVRNRDHLAAWEPTRAADFETLPYWQSFVENAQREGRASSRSRYVATPHESPRIVACITLSEITRGVAESAILGYSLDAAELGRGLAREAVGAVVEHAFSTLGLHRIEANYQPHNLRSGRLLSALGFNVEGYARDYLFIDGAWRDHVLTARTNASLAKLYASGTHAS